MSFLHHLRSFFHETGGALTDKADIERQIVEKLVKETLNNEVAKAMLSVQKDAAQEFVGGVIIPVLETVLKPVETIGFSAASSIVGTLVDFMEEIVEQKYTPPQKIIERVRGYTKGGVNEHWLRVLVAFGDKGTIAEHPDLTPMTVAEARKEMRVWGGWYPIVQQLRYVENANGIVDDLNAMSIYLSAKTNITTGIYFQNLYDRGRFLKDDLKNWAHRGLPLTQSGMNELLLELGPDKLELTEEAKIAFGIVIGESAGLWNIPTSLLLPYIDKVMDQLGVPK